MGRLTDASLSCCYSYNSRLSAISVSAEAKHANVTVHIWVRLVKYCSERSVMCTGLTKILVFHTDRRGFATHIVHASTSSMTASA